MPTLPTTSQSIGNPSTNVGPGDARHITAGGKAPAAIAPMGAAPSPVGSPGSIAHPCVACPYRQNLNSGTVLASVPHPDHPADEPQHVQGPEQPAVPPGFVVVHGIIVDPLENISINEFCRRSKLARSTVNKMVKSQGPGLEPALASKKAGRRRLIPLIAAICWLNGAA